MTLHFINRKKCKTRCINKMFLLLFALIFWSCEFLVDVVTDDSMDEITYNINHEMNEISLWEDIDLEIIESSDSILIITGPRAVLDEFSIKNVEGNLKISYDKRGSWMYDKPLVKMYLPEIMKISLYRHNDLYANDTIKADSLNVFSDGTGDIHLKVNNKLSKFSGTNVSNFYVSGKTDSLDVSCTFSSSFKGANLFAQKVVVSSYCSNDQVVYPVKSLLCNIRLNGNIYYVNEPDKLIVNIIDNGSGKAIYDSQRD